MTDTSVESGLPNVGHDENGNATLEWWRGDDSPYVVADVWLSEREFEDLPEHDGF